MSIKQWFNNLLIKNHSNSKLLTLHYLVHYRGNMRYRDNFFVMAS